MKAVGFILILLLGLVAVGVAQGGPSQQRLPVEQLQIYVDGFHNYIGEDGRPADSQTQMRVTHYCHPLPSGVIQCVIFDGTTPNSRLIGVGTHHQRPGLSSPSREREGLLASSRWRGGQRNARSSWYAPEKANELKQMIRTTHGKTWHVWDSASNGLPLGQPRLMWAVPPKELNTKTRTEMKSRDQNPTFGPQ